MSLIWTRQPQIVVPVNRGNSITSGMFAAALAAPGAEAASMTPLQSVTSRAKSTGPIGLALDPAGGWVFGPSAGGALGARNPFSYNLTAGSISGNYSALFVGQRNTADSVTKYGLGEANQGAAIEWYVQMTGGDIYAWFNIVGVTNNYTQIVGSLTQGEVFALLYSYTMGVGPTVYARNLSRNKSFPGQAIAALTGTPFEGYANAGSNIQAIASSSFGAGVPTFLDARWRRALTSVEANALLLNPWQIFQPLSRPVFFAPSAGGGTAYTLTADAGSYSVSGQANTLTYARTMPAAAGSYSVSGQAATFAYARTLTATAGSYALTGQASTLTYARTLTALAGSYAVTGQDATLTYTPKGTVAYTLTADAGAYAVSGQAATLTYVSNAPISYVLTADAGVYAVDGQNAVLSYRTVKPRGGGPEVEAVRNLHRQSEADLLLLMQAALDSGMFGKH